MIRRFVRVVIALVVLAAAMQMRTLGRHARVASPVTARPASPRPPWLPKPASDRATIYTLGGEIPLNGARPSTEKRGGR